MSTGRRGSRLSELASPTKNANAMNVDDDSEEESFEDIVARKTPKKRTAKQTATPAKSKAKPSKNSSTSSGTDLYAIIKEGAVLSTTVTEWLDTYCANEAGKLDSALSLIELIFKLALFTGEVPKKAVLSSTEQTIDATTKEFLKELNDKEGEVPEFPLTPKSKQFKKFQMALARFWRVLVENGSDSAFGDEFLLTRLVMWMARLSHSPFRPLRYAAVVCGFHLMRGLLVNLEKLTTQLAKRTKQVASEAKLSGKKSGGGDAGSKLDAELKSMKARGEVVESAIKRLWNEVFGAAWHDLNEETRILSVECFGEWCLLYPKFFMDSERFKYLVWLMGDPDPACRTDALKVLIKLVDEEDLRPQMRAFTSRLQERLLWMVREIHHDSVCTHAIFVLARLREIFGADFVKPEIVEEVQRLISVNNPDVRAAVGAFISIDIIGEPTEDEDTSSSQKAVKKSAAANSSNKRVLKDRAVTQLRAMLNFIENSTAHTELPYYVVDAIWDNTKEFFLFAFGDSADLLSIPSTSKQHLSDSQQVLLAKAVLGTLARLKGKPMTGKTGSLPKPDVVKSLLINFTEAYYPILPELLLNHQADNEVLIPLLSISRYLDLAHLSKQSSGKKSVLLLIQNIKKILTTNTNQDVLKKSASALEHIASNSTFQRNVDSTMVNIVASLMDTLNAHVEKFEAPGSSQVGKPKKRASDLDSSDFVDGAAPGTAELVLCLLRLETLSNFFDLNRMDASILEAATKVIETRADGLFQIVGPRSAASATKLVCTLVAYKLNALPLENPNNTSKSTDHLDYDVSQKKAKQDADEAAAAADPEEEDGDNDDADAEEGEDGEKKKKKKKKRRSSVGPQSKVATAAVSVSMPTERELKDFAAQVALVISKLTHMLDIKADDTDVNDVAPYAAFHGIANLLLLFSRKLSDVPQLSLLVQKPTVELEESLVKFYEEEMSKPLAHEDHAALERSENTLNYYASLVICDVFGEPWETNLPRVTAQLRQDNDRMAGVVRHLLKVLREQYGNPASYAQHIVDTLVYELQLKPNDPEAQDDDEEKAQRMRRLSRALERSFPIGKDFAATCCKLIVSKLVEQSLKDPDFAPLLTWAGFFIVKVQPAGARDLLTLFRNRFDPTFTGLEGLEAPYEELKELLKERATGKKRAKATASRAGGKKKKGGKKGKVAEEEEEEETAKSDDDDEHASQASQASSTYTRTKATSTKAKTPLKTPKKAAATAAATGKTPKKSGADSAKKSTPKRATAAAKRSGGRASISVIHQGGGGDDDESSLADSEMAHTDDERSEDEAAKEKRTPRTRTSVAILSQKPKEVDYEEEEDEDEKAAVGEAMDVDEPMVGASQASVEIPMTAQDEEAGEPEPRGSRPKRGRTSHLSQTSAASPNQHSTASRKAGADKEEGSGDENEPAPDVDSDDLMEHTPSTKRRQISRKNR